MTGPHNAANSTDNPFGPLLHTPAVSEQAASKALFGTAMFVVLVVFNALSLTSSAACIALMTCLRRRRRHAAYLWGKQPVSLRMILHASVIDIGYTVFRVYDMALSQGGTQENSERSCQAVMWGTTFFSLLSVFIRALLSVHLHAVLVYRVSRPASYERRFVAGALLLALLLSLLPLTRYSYSWVDYDPTLGSGHCSYFSLATLPRELASSPPERVDARRAVVAGLAWCWATYFGWIALTVAYCVFVVVAAVMRLWRDRRRTDRLIAHHQQLLDGSPSGSPSGSDEYMFVFTRWSDERGAVWRMAQRVLRRVVQFPATIILCHSLEVAWSTATLVRIIPILRSGEARDTSDLKRLYMAMQVMLTMQGIFTLLSLAFEPTIKEMLAEWRAAVHSSLCAKWGSANGPAAGGGPEQALETKAPPPPTLESMPWDIIVCSNIGARTARQAQAT